MAKLEIEKLEASHSKHELGTIKQEVPQQRSTQANSFHGLIPYAHTCRSKGCAMS